LNTICSPFFFGHLLNRRFELEHEGIFNLRGTPINPDAQCNHTEHSYKSKVSLLDTGSE
jgi:hypothetical protein